MQTISTTQTFKIVIDRETTIFPQLEVFREDENGYVAFIELPLETWETHGILSAKEAEQKAKQYLRDRFGKKRLHCISKVRYRGN